jgi:hypothetical protein
LIKVLKKSDTTSRLVQKTFCTVLIGLNEEVDVVCVFEPEGEKKKEERKSRRSKLETNERRERRVVRAEKDRASGGHAQCFKQTGAEVF